jgi:flagellar assembly factor FliW
VEIYDEYVAALGIEGPADAVVLVIMTVAQPPAECTVNLLGPLVVNRRNLKAAQVVQYTSDYQVAVPISAATAHWRA